MTDSTTVTTTPQSSPAEAPRGTRPAGASAVASSPVATPPAATGDQPLTALVPEPEHLELLGDLPAGTRAALWSDYEDLDGSIAPESVGFVVISGRGGQQRRDHLKTFPNLRGVRTVSIGYDWVIDSVPAGVPVFNSSQVMTDTTAETGALAIMASLRSLPEHLEAQRQHRWIEFSERGPHEHGLTGIVGTTVLVIGQGGIGRGIADRLEAFKARVVRFARTARTGPGGEKVHAMEELNDWLPQADAVSLALPLNPGTDGLVDADFLSRMKPGAVLGNIGRGKVVDTAALVEALTAGTIRAALDVVDPEPLPADHPLWDCPGLLLTPHAGADSRYMREHAVADQAAMVRAFLSGDDLGDPVIVK